MLGPLGTMLVGEALDVAEPEGDFGGLHRLVHRREEAICHIVEADVSAQRRREGGERAAIGRDSDIDCDSEVPAMQCTLAVLRTERRLEESDNALDDTSSLRPSEKLRR